jgi:hypothetical protein
MSSVSFHPVNPYERQLIDSLPIDVLINLTTDQGGQKRNKSSPASAPSRSGHRLRLNLYEARDLPGVSWFSDKSDTYVTIALQGTKNRVSSRIVKETVNPTYNEAWDFQLSENPLNDVMLIIVHAHHSITSDQFLGRIEVPLSMILSLPQARRLESCWLPLQPNLAQYAENKCKGSVRLGFEYFFDPNEQQIRFLQEQATALAMMDSRQRGPTALPAPMMPPIPYVRDLTPSQPAMRPPEAPAAARISPAQMLTATHSAGGASEPCPVCNLMVASSVVAAHVESHFSGASPSQPPAPTMSAPRPAPTTPASNSIQGPPPGYRLIYPIDQANASRLAAASMPPPAAAPMPVMFPPNPPAPMMIDPAAMPMPMPMPMPLPVPSRPVPPPPTADETGTGANQNAARSQTPSLDELEAQNLAEAIRQSEEMARDHARLAAAASVEMRPLRAQPPANITTSEVQLMADLTAAMQQRQTMQSTMTPSAPPFADGHYLLPARGNSVSSTVFYPTIPPPAGVMPLTAAAGNR